MKGKQKPRILALLTFVVLVFGMVLGSGAEVAADWIGFDKVQASSYLVMDAETGEFLIEHNIDELRYVASVTKIATAMAVITDPAYDPERILTASADGTYFPDPASSRIGLVAGEQLRTIDALHMLMVHSANDCANLLAEGYAGIEGSYYEKIAAFAVKMNKFASDHGANNTSFNNPSGFDVEGHLTTARDVAIMAGYAMQNDLFQDLVSRRAYRVPATNVHSDEDWAIKRSTSMLVQLGPEVYGSDYFVAYDGIKTGTTPRAGYCLVTSGRLPEGNRLIGILLNTTLAIDGRTVDIALPMRALLEEGARRYRETKPYVEPTPSPTPAPTPELTEPVAEETTAAVAIVTTPEPTDTGSSSFLSDLDPMLIFIVAGIGVLLIIIVVYLWIESRRQKRRRRRKEAMRKLREMQDIGDPWRNPPRR